MTREEEQAWINQDKRSPHWNKAYQKHIQKEKVEGRENSEENGSGQKRNDGKRANLNRQPTKTKAQIKARKKHGPHAIMKVAASVAALAELPFEAEAEVWGSKEAEVAAER